MNNNSNNMSCAIYTHTPARNYTNFQLYYFVIQFCSTNWLGHGHGYKWHSSTTPSLPTNIVGFGGYARG